MTDKQISEILEEEGYSFTDNLEESVFILKNGNLVDGGFFGGNTRTIEHREIAESVVLDKDRYDNGCSRNKRVIDYGKTKTI